MKFYYYIFLLVLLWSCNSEDQQIIEEPSTPMKVLQYQCVRMQMVNPTDSTQKEGKDTKDLDWDWDDDDWDDIGDPWGGIIDDEVPSMKYPLDHIYMIIRKKVGKDYIYYTYIKKVKYGGFNLCFAIVQKEDGSKDIVIKGDDDDDDDDEDDGIDLDDDDLILFSSVGTLGASKVYNFKTKATTGNTGYNSKNTPYTKVRLRSSDQKTPAGKPTFLPVGDVLFTSNKYYSFTFRDIGTQEKPNYMIAYKESSVNQSSQFKPFSTSSAQSTSFYLDRLTTAIQPRFLLSDQLDKVEINQDENFAKSIQDRFITELDSLNKWGVRSFITGGYEDPNNPNAISMPGLPLDYKINNQYFYVPSGKDRYSEECQWLKGMPNLFKGEKGIISLSQKAATFGIMKLSESRHNEMISKDIWGLGYMEYPVPFIYSMPKTGSIGGPYDEWKLSYDSWTELPSLKLEDINQSLYLYYTFYYTGTNKNIFPSQTGTEKSISFKIKLTEKLQLSAGDFEQINTIIDVDDFINTVKGQPLVKENPTTKSTEFIKTYEDPDFGTVIEYPAKIIRKHGRIP